MESPRVSIVLLCYNKLELTRACIESLAATDPTVPYEVIVVDNGSDDETPEYLKCLEGDVRIESIYPNVGFIRANNQGAKLARGEFILFLNNDTVLLPNWLEPMVELMDEDPKVGAVSPMLIFPDGRVNDAGGLVFADGECWRYGMWDAIPDNPKLNSRRAVDYAMGACLLIRRHLWEQIGGFDERFIPAYYEDVDLSFSIRAIGYKTMYEPKSRIVHVEGGTNGSDTSAASSHKQYQVVNREKFADKWADELSNRPKMDARIVENWAHRGQGGFGPHEEPVETWNQALVKQTESKNVLIFDPLVPMFDRNSGHRRLWNVIEQLRLMGHSVTYFSNSSYRLVEYKAKLGELGVPVYGLDERYGDKVDTMDPTLREVFIPNFYEWGARQEFDTIVINFWALADQLIPFVRKAWPKAAIVVDSVDVHFLREEREAAVHGDPNLVAKAAATKTSELRVYRAADRVLACTETDAEVLRVELPDKEVVVITNTHELDDPGPGFKEREGILFVGNFSHPANTDALFWWMQQIAPELEKHLPGVPLTVIGHDPVNMVRTIANYSLNPLGWVQDLTPHLHRARISVAPLRFGAGMKGKVGEALSFGLPVVGTSIAAEGMDLTHEHDVLVADTPGEFAAAVVRLYHDEVLWNSLRENGRAVVAQRWGKDTLRMPLTEAISPPRVVKASTPAVSKNKRYTPPSKSR